MTGSEQTTDKHASRLGTSFGILLLKAVVLFVVIAGGVATGFLVANHLSKRDVVGGFEIEPSDLLNQTALAIGDTLPDITVLDGRDSTLALTPLVRGHKAILGSVSRGCEPCDELLEFLEERNLREAGRCGVVLLAAGVQRYEAEGYDVYRIDRPTIDELKIRIFPTVIGMNPDRTVAFVSSGFSRVMTAPVIDKHL